MNKKEKVRDYEGTPQDLFDVLDKGGFYQGIQFDGFRFDIDLCATAENSKCFNFAVDYLDNVFADKVRSPCSYEKDDFFMRDTFKSCFINPPYSNPKPFIKKAWEDSKYCKIVCLVKCDPSAKWWATFWDYDYCVACESSPCIRDSLACECDSNHMRGPKPGCEVIFFPNRIRFTPPKNITECLCVRGLTAAGPQEIYDVLNCLWCNGTGEIDETYRTLYTDICTMCRGGGVFGSEAVKCIRCHVCKGVGNFGSRWVDKTLSGPSFASALVIMDRRSI